MLPLATQAVPQMRQHAHPSLGRLVTPRHYPSLRATIADGGPWGADNDGFGGNRPLFRFAARGAPQQKSGLVLTDNLTADGSHLQAVADRDAALARPAPAPPRARAATSTSLHPVCQRKPHPPTSAASVTALTSRCTEGASCTTPTDAVSYPVGVPAASTPPPAVKIANATAGTGMGIFTVTPTITVTVPANSFAGTYTSTLSPS